MKYGYLRVSTNTQDETRQREALKKIWSFRRKYLPG